MLSKKHYTRIANILNQNLVNNKSLDDVVADLASYFKEDNPAFNKQRFYDACYKPKESPCHICPHDEKECRKAQHCFATGGVR